MSRTGLTDTYVTSSVSSIRAAYLAYLDFTASAAPTRIWTGLENKTFTDFSGSATYQAIGTLGTISPIAETTEVSAKGIDLVLTGVDSNYLSLAFSNSYRGRTAAVYLVLFNEAMTSYQQTMIFRGRMDQMIITEGAETSVITLRCESRLVDLNRAKETRYTDEYQKSLYPNDKGLEFVAAIAGKSVYWGQSSPGSNIADMNPPDGNDGNTNSP